MESGLDEGDGSLTMTLISSSELGGCYFVAWSSRLCWVDWRQQGFCFLSVVLVLACRCGDEAWDERSCWRKRPTMVGVDGQRFVLDQGIAEGDAVEGCNSRAR